MLAFLAAPNARPAENLGGLEAFIDRYQAILAIPALAGLLALVWLFFRDTWRALDEDSHRDRARLLAQGRMDHRPFVALSMIALILTLQDSFGGRLFYDASISPLLKAYERDGHPWIMHARYEDLYGFGWWAGTRILGYVAPFAFWRLFFRRDSLLDLGLRARGFFDHAWIYGLFLVVVVPAMVVVSHSPDFRAYYPFYKLASRSWYDFLCWEAMYFLQFLALEMFFRGFWLGVLRRSFGSGAIFVMAVPYCMIHFTKPYLEVCGAIVAGIALGSLSMKTKSIYQGFLVHVTVAGMMDWLSLRHRKATPLQFWNGYPMVTGSAFAAQEEEREALAQTIERIGASVFAVLLVALVVLVLRARRRRLLARV